ncbi:MAG: CvpA family protein [Deltaproteobacteria bacterium]|nr:CvpA family protein [Deltaproteobacteria bacterium]
MNILDISILCTMVFFLLRGIFRGFLREIASLAGIVLGILLGSLFQPQITDLLKAYVPDFYYLPLVSFVFIFTAVLIVSNLLGYALSRLFKKIFLGWVDRLLGVGLALTKGIILTYLIIVLLTFFLPAKAPLVANSKLAPWIIVSYQSMIRMISPERYETWKKRLLGEDQKKETSVPGTVSEGNGQKRTGQILP